MKNTRSVPQGCPYHNTQGTLLIDLIDPAANALIAEGAAQSRLRSSEITRQQSDDVVGQIMADMMPR